MVVEEVTQDRIVLVPPWARCWRAAGGGTSSTPFTPGDERQAGRRQRRAHARPGRVAFAALDERLPGHLARRGRVRRAAVARFTQTGSLIESAGLGRALAETIGDGVGCLVPRHGLVTAGPDAATAVMRASCSLRRAMSSCRRWRPARSGCGRPGRDRAEEGGGLAESQFNAGYASWPNPASRRNDGPMAQITVGVVAPAYVDVPLWVTRERGPLQPRAQRRRTDPRHHPRGDERAAGRHGDIALTAPEGNIADAVAGGPLRVVAGLIDRPPLSMIAVPSTAASTICAAADRDPRP